MSAPRGPRLASWIVQRLLRPLDAERILGDLDEEYVRFQRPAQGRLRADLWYWRQAVASIWALREGLLASAFGDARFALRTLRRSPIHTATAVATLALGIGATTAIFSVVDAVLLAPLPYPEADRIVRGWPHADDGDVRDFSFRTAEVVALEGRRDLFEAVGAEFPWSATVHLAGLPPQQISGRRVTAGLFEVFGVSPAVGRRFTADDVVAGGAPVVVVSHALWAGLLAGDTAAIGRTLDIAGTPFELVGVLPEDYAHVSGDDADAFIPYTLGTAAWTGRWLGVYGRLPPGFPPDRAADEITAVMQGVAAEQGRAGGWHATVQDLRSTVVGDVRPMVWASFGMVGVVLLIAVVNVAALTIARSGARRAEMSIRRALGAGRPRLIRQLLVESLVLGTIGGAMGMALGFAGLRGLLALAPPSIPRLGEAAVDLRVLAFALVVTVVAAVLFGVGPAVGTAEARRGGRGVVLRGLVVAEVALALTLLVGAGLMVRTVRALSVEDLGFHGRQAITFRVEAPEATWPDVAGSAGFYAELLARLGRLDGVEAVGAGSDLPVSGQGAVATVNSEERVRAGHEEGVTTLQRRATPGFFEALGTPVVAGRPIGADDRPDAEATVVVSASLARRLFDGRPAVGQRVGFGNTPSPDEWMRIVGVVGDVRYRDAALIDDPQIYQPHAQSAVRGMALVVRTAREPSDLLLAIRGVVHELDGRVAVHDVQTLEAMVSRVMAPRRFTMTLFGSFAVAALFLTLAGVYGVLAFGVARRRREIGVRLALGARTTDVTGLVVRQGMRLVLAGLLLGWVGAALASRALTRLLYGVEPTDPATYAGVSLILAIAGLAACLVPAWTSARTDPVAVLSPD